MKLRSTFFLALTLVATALVAQEAQPQQQLPFTIDRGHSSVTFTVRHNMIAKVSGRFSDFEGAININRDNPAASSVDFTIKSASVDTANENRDKHLKSADFFDVEKFPAITFKSSSVAKGKVKDTYDVTGDFTMHGVTKKVTLPVTFLGFGKNNRGMALAGFEIETTLNRKDFGIVWNRTLDEGGVVVSDDVKVAIAIESVQRPPQPPAPPVPPAAPPAQ